MTKNRIMITGANGQLGSEIRALAAQYLDLDFIFTDIRELDILNAVAVERFIVANGVGTIVNCAAYTAVDKAESEAVLCERINREAVGHLGRAATQHKALVIHISTDYVYSGTHYRPYVESDTVAPTSVYGMTKLQGEQALMAVAPASLVFRTSWLYSTYGSNFVKTMIRLGAERDSLDVIFDQIGTPTYAADLAQVILDIVRSEKFVSGIYNYSNEGVCSWYDFAIEIHKLAGLNSCKVKPIEGREYPTAAARPFYSVMNKKKVKNTFGLEIPHWRDSLQRCIASLKQLT